ncbi:MAG: divalent-cation tolerance protein CutA [Thermodesulfobacteriota bacterium]
MDEAIIQVTTTVDSQETAERIARLLVEERLAACVQVSGPITSCYRWQGTVETSSEYLCVAKSRMGLYPAMEAAIRKAHPYEVPEILALPVVAGGGDYLAWLRAETGGEP